MSDDTEQPTIPHDEAFAVAMAIWKQIPDSVVAELGVIHKNMRRERCGGLRLQLASGTFIEIDLTGRDDYDLTAYEKPRSERINTRTTKGISDEELGEAIRGLVRRAP